MYITPNTITEEDDGTMDVGGNVVVIIGIVAGTIVIVGLFVLIYCLYKRKLTLEESVANQVNEKASMDVMEVVEIDKSHNIIMSDDVFFGVNNNSTVEEQVTQPSPKKRVNRNRRARTRQVLEIRDYD